MEMVSPFSQGTLRIGCVAEYQYFPVILSRYTGRVSCGKLLEALFEPIIGVMFLRLCKPQKRISAFNDYITMPSNISVIFGLKASHVKHLANLYG